LTDVLGHDFGLEVSARIIGIRLKQYKTDEFNKFSNSKESLDSGMPRILRLKNTDIDNRTLQKEFVESQKIYRVSPWDSLNSFELHLSSLKRIWYKNELSISLV
jgi:hypothetical protein